MKPQPRKAMRSGGNGGQFTRPGFGIRDSGFVGSGHSSPLPVHGSGVPVEGFFVPVHAASAARKAARESVKDLPDASRQRTGRGDFGGRCRLQSKREFELRLTFGVRAQGDRDVMTIIARLVAMPLGNIRWDRYGSATQLGGESKQFFSWKRTCERVHSLSEVHPKLPCLEVSI